ncbi:hypothetical protein BDV38DRAFT_279056 [Aspergillus pseudotamarii]|uniref:Uncharacterized protein n=1 Tax=Aspergillus pseudotamarii TaxID=132259 RepID=A0A5N6T5W1_ASPPS|nr:uncharacterized protein BDV38DRAFT_279056 [Aspergillus pseudotamarii]KAE8141707.1 hypothetical protein BDV38DRAFT_279056 [Aspergillus pseudotamarii]
MKIAVALSVFSLALAVPRFPSPALSETGPNNYNNPYNANKAQPPFQRPPSPALSDTQPATQQPPVPIPANIQGLDSSFSVKCGQFTFPGADIHRAVSLGVNLDRHGQQLAKFPHDYANIENFNFLHPQCRGNGGLHRREIPIVKGGYFKGNWEDLNQFRAIFVHNIWSMADAQGRPSAIYCGTIYHPRGTNTFNGCDVRKLKS